MSLLWAAALTVVLSSGFAPPLAGSARAEGTWLAQAPEPSGEEEEEEDDDDSDDVPIPPNLLENDNPFAADSTAAPSDTGAVRPDSSATMKSTAADSAKAFQSAQPETLHSFPRSVGALPSPAEKPAPIPKTKPDRGPFGLSPFFLVLGLAAVHIFVVRSID